jgi:hypothetical protein
VEVIYMDNLETMVHEWEKILAGAVKMWEASGGAAADPATTEVVLRLLLVKLRQDVFHFLDRYARVTVGQGNGLFNEFLKDLSVAVMPFDEDEAAIQDALHPNDRWKAHHAKLRHCRRCGA